MSRNSVDPLLLFITRSIRLFGFGLLSVILVFYLASRGLSEAQAGLVLTLALFGDVLVSLAMATHADRFGRRRTLAVSALLIVFTGTVLAASGNFALIGVVALIGVISPSGNEIGPFLAIEQAALSQITPGVARTRIFAWYYLAGSVATALGALSGGALVQSMQSASVSELDSQRTVLIVYAGLGILLFAFFCCLSKRVEASPPSRLP